MVHLQSAFLSTIIASSSPFPEEEEEVVDSMKKPRLGDPYGHPIHEVASLRIFGSRKSWAQRWNVRNSYRTSSILLQTTNHFVIVAPSLSFFPFCVAFCLFLPFPIRCCNQRRNEFFRKEKRPHRHCRLSPLLMQSCQTDH